jgi:hypothetical protein
MTYKVNTKISNEAEYIEKRLKDCHYWLQLYPNSRKWNKRLNKYLQYKKDFLLLNRSRKINKLKNLISLNI